MNTRTGTATLAALYKGMRGNVPGLRDKLSDLEDACICDALGQTPLEVAIECGNHEAFDVLVKMAPALESVPPQGAEAINMPS